MSSLDRNVVHSVQHPTLTLERTYPGMGPCMGPDRAYTIGDDISSHLENGRRRVNADDVLIGQTVHYREVQYSK